MEKFIAQCSAPVGYAAEYLIPSLSDVLATIALPHSVTYLLRGVNGETLDLQLPNSPSPPHTSLCLSTRYVTYRNMCRTPRQPANLLIQSWAHLPSKLCQYVFNYISIAHKLKPIPSVGKETICFRRVEQVKRMFRADRQRRRKRHDYAALLPPGSLPLPERMGTCLFRDSRS